MWITEYDKICLSTIIISKKWHNLELYTKLSTLSTMIVNKMGVDDVEKNVRKTNRCFVKCDKKTYIVKIWLTSELYIIYEYFL